MSTRCRIGIKLPDGKIKSIYSHWDGYPEGVGKKLLKYYDTPEKINELMDLGDISSLGEIYDEAVSKADWDDPRAALKDDGKTYTVAYKDRGEDVPARVDKDEIEYISKAGNCCEEYTYLYKEGYDGIYEWYCLEVPYFKNLQEFLKGDNDGK